MAPMAPMAPMAEQRRRRSKRLDGGHRCGGRAQDVATGRVSFGTPWRNDAQGGTRVQRVWVELKNTVVWEHIYEST